MNSKNRMNQGILFPDFTINRWKSG